VDGEQIARVGRVRFEVMTERDDMIVDGAGVTRRMQQIAQAQTHRVVIFDQQDSHEY
jgi:hypothetical protein